MQKTNVAWMLIASLALFAPAFYLGHIPGDSGKFNVAWVAEFADELFGGNLYPRWLPGMNAGAGGADFYFYAPLPFYFAAPFTLVADGKMAVVLVSWAMLLASGLAMYTYASTRFSNSGALLSAVLYMAGPYHFVLVVWTRNAIGEQAAYIFMPLILLCADRLDRGNNAIIALALSYAALVHSHLATTLLFTPVLVAYCLAKAWRLSEAAVIYRAAAAAILSALLSAAYLVPVLTMMDMIHSEIWDTFKPSLNFLFADASNLSDLVPEYYAIIHVAASLTLIAALAAVATVVKIGAVRKQLPFILIICVFAALNLELSAVIWNLISVFDRVQFPWRALSLIELAAAVLIGSLLVNSASRSALFLIFFLVIAAGGLIGTGHATYDNLQIMRYTEQVEDVPITKRWSPVEYYPACLETSHMRALSDDILAGPSSGDGARSPLYYPMLASAHGEALICDPETGRIANYDTAKPIVLNRPNTEIAANMVSVLALFAALAVWIRFRRRSQTSDCDQRFNSP